jgi:hypothetical protein
MTDSESSANPGLDAATRSPADNLENLESAANSLLIAEGIYDIGNYCWLNENDADPEFIGHAMWQTDQPLARALDDPFDERIVSELPSLGTSIRARLPCRRIHRGHRNGTGRYAERGHVRDVSPTPSAGAMLAQPRS